TGDAVLAKQRYAIDLLRTLFDNLLDLSRFDAGEVRLSPRVMKLRDVLVPLATEYELLCHAKRIDFRVEIADVFVRTDAELLRRLLANLLSNAVRYTERGSVSLLARAGASHVLIEVRDSGIGIPRDDQDRVFEE